MKHSDMWEGLKQFIQKKEQPAEKDEHAMGYFQAIADVKGWMGELEKCRFMDAAYRCAAGIPDLLNEHTPEFSSKDK